MTQSSISDQVASLSLPRSAERAFAVIDTVQAWGDNPQAGAEIVLGLGISFLVMCRRFNLDPREVLSGCARRIRDGQAQNNQHVLAMRSYLREDIAGDVPFSF